MDSNRVFFVTTVTANRQPIFRRDPVARLLIEILAHYRDERKFLLHEFVIMPDHVHALLTPAPEISLERALQFIKGGFSFRLKSRLPVWQASFMNHRLRDSEDCERHREYIWMNPVRTSWAERPEAYPYSSAFLRGERAAARPNAIGAKARFFGGSFDAALQGSSSTIDPNGPD
jgi:putative transposase